MTNRIAVDTNILIYLHEDSPTSKTEIAKRIVRDFPVISTQVISEYINVLKRLLAGPKLRLIEHCLVLTEGCIVTGINNEILSKARDLIAKNDFQIFDSIIVASALIADCKILYSEDLQHGQVIDRKLTIINPFL